MLYSMTGFGKSVKEFPGKKVTIEIKSLNSKQADIATRIPASLRQHELEMRTVIADTLVRGKIDLSVTVESRGGETSQAINVAAMEAYKKQIQDAVDRLGIPEPADWFGTLLRFPDTLHVEQSVEADDSEVSATMVALREALDALTAHRRAEGEKLEAFFTDRVNNISALLAKVPQYEGERTAKVRARMEEGLTKLNGVDYDRSRLEQELFFYIEKFDITEEKLTSGTAPDIFHRHHAGRWRAGQEARVYRPGDGARDQHTRLEKQPFRHAAPGGADEG